MEGVHFIASALGAEIPSDATAPSPSGFETEKRDRVGSVAGRREQSTTMMIDVAMIYEQQLIIANCTVDCASLPPLSLIHI